MKKIIYLIALICVSLTAFSQTQDKLPPNAKPYGNQLYFDATTGLIWSGLGSSKFRAIGTKTDIDSLQNQIDDLIPLSQKAVSNGVATLDGSGKVPLTQINDALLGAVNYRGNYDATANSPALPTAAIANKGYYWIVSVAGTQQGLTFRVGDWVISNGSVYGKVASSSDVESVAGRKGVVVLAKGDVGLNNADNTSDANKPISTATQTALALKANDNAVLHIAGVESVIGPKTFVSPVIASSNLNVNGNLTTAFNTQSATMNVTGAFTGNSGQFSGTVSGAAPTTASHLTNKNYVDDLVSGYALKTGGNTSGTWPISITGNAGSATSWGARQAALGEPVNFVDQFLVTDGLDNKVRLASNNQIKSYLGLGSAAFLNANEAALNQQIVKRTADGDILGRYFGMTGGVSGSGISDVIGTNGSDGYMRRYDALSFRNFLGLGTASGFNIGQGNTEIPFNQDITLQSVTNRGFTTTNGITVGALSIPFNPVNISSRTWTLAKDVAVYGDFSIGQSTLQSGGTLDWSKFYISSTGNIGIGTTVPASGGANARWLTLNGSAYGGGVISSVNDVVKGYLYYSNSSNTYRIQGADGAGIGISVNGVNDAVTILPNESMGIGTISPTEKLTVAGNVLATTFKSGNANWSGGPSGDYVINYNNGATGPFQYYGGTTGLKFSVAANGNAELAGTLGVATPTLGTHAATKNYVDAQIAGLTYPQTITSTYSAPAISTLVYGTPQTIVVPFTGANVGDIVMVAPTSVPASVVISTRVTAANEITIIFNQIGSGGVSFAAQSYKIKVFK